MDAGSHRFFQGLIKGNIAQVLAQQGKHYEAIPLLKADIAASLYGAAPYPYRDNGIKSLIHLSKSYLATGQLKLAEDRLAEAKDLEQKDDPAENRIAWLQTKARLLRAQGKHEQAFEALERAEEVEDSALLASKKDRANKLLQTYRYSLDREIMERSEEVARLGELAAQQRRFNWVFMGLIALALFTSTYFTVLYRQNKARRKELEVKNQQNQQQKSQLEQALNEQEVLLREVNHRVKNNLQVISSMLFLEQRKLTDASIKQVLRDVQERIRTMSNIHQKLYMRHQSQGEELLFEHYVKDLVEGIINSYVGEEKAITFTHRIKIKQLPVDQTIPLSLILHQLVTNSVKHAFNLDNSGSIHIAFEEVQVEGKTMIYLAYADNGSGLSHDDIEGRDSSTIGMKLIELLTHRLQSSITMKNKHGFHCEISFPSQSAQPTFAA